MKLVNIQVIPSNHINKKKKITIASGTWLNSWLHSLSPPDYEQEPRLNEMDFLEIDLLGPQPIRSTKSATTYSTIHQKTM